MKSFPLHYTDFYKTDHVHQYPPGTEYVYSNFTPRSSRNPDIKAVVVFGIQYFIAEYFDRQFGDYFFSRPKRSVIADYKRRLDTALGPNAVDLSHIEALHDLGYLPLHIKALPEGTLCPIGVPLLTITNTDPRFFWLPNFFETLLSTSLWGPITSATIAHEFRSLLDHFAAETSDIPEFVDWQCHDFSMRGMNGLEAACMSGAGHLLSFTGTDTIPAIDFLETYYYADADQELIGGSVPATEHSVMCMDGPAGEYETIKRLITEVYPAGIVSVVCDSWNYWDVINHFLPKLKPEIMARDGKLVVRPDSGDPVDIILETIPKLWDTFGGTVNSKGFKQLDPHIGLIYGDSINYDRADLICSGLFRLGFASTNVVFGVGSYTYQLNTRDTFGMAMKATWGVVNGEEREIFKDPATDDGTKRSAKGLLSVLRDEDGLYLVQNATKAQERSGELKTVYRNGNRPNIEFLNIIRKRLHKQSQPLLA